MKTGCCGGDLQGAFPAPLPARVFGGTGAMAALQGTGRPAVSMAGKLRVAGMAKPCLVNFRLLPSRIISALNLF